MSETLKEALIYCRVSDPKQKSDGHGLEAQELRCRQFAQQQGYVLAADPFLDDVSGGGNFNKRPKLMEMFDFLKRNKGKRYAVIVDEITRASRDVYFYWDLIYKLEDLGAYPVSPNFNFERTPEGNLQQSVTVAAGAYQREAIARSTRQKMIARMEQGFHVFIAPVGFKVVKTKEHGKMLFRDEPVASVIAEAFEGFASGRFQTKAEARYFLEAHPQFPTGRSGKMGNGRIDSILNNPLYAGYVGYEPWGVSVRPGRHEGMTTYETFLKVQERLKGRAYAPTRKNIHRQFPLRGSVVCECGNALTSSTPRSCTGKRYAYYHCQTKTCDHYGKSIPSEKVHGEFEELLRGLKPSKPVFISFTKMFKKLWDHQLASQGARSKALTQQARQIDRNIETALDKIMESNSPTVTRGLEKRIEQLEDEKLVLDEKIANCGRPTRSYDDMYRTALTFLAKPHKLWAQGRFEEKRAVVKLVLTDRITYVRNQGYRTPDLSLPFKALGGFFSFENVMVPRRGLEPPRPCEH